MAQDRVEVAMGFTRNLGNFQSMRIDVTYGSDAHEGENPDDLFKRVYDFVEEHYLAEFDDVEAEVKVKTKGWKQEDK